MLYLCCISTSLYTCCTCAVSRPAGTPAAACPESPTVASGAG
jgi:hypothetical protein